MSDTKEITAGDLFAPVYYQPHNDIFDELYLEYWFKGGRGCVSGETLLDTPSGKIPVKDFKGGEVYSWDGNKIIVATALKPRRYTEESLYRVVLESGKSILVTDQHRFLTKSGWKTAKDLAVGETLVSASSSAFAPSSSDRSNGPSQVLTASSYSREKHYGESRSRCSEDVLHSIRKLLGLLYRCWNDFRLCDGQPLSEEDTYLDVLQRLAYAPQHIHCNSRLDDLGGGRTRIHHEESFHHSMQDCLLRSVDKYYEGAGSETLRMLSELLSETFPSALQCLETEDLDGSIRQVSRHLLLSIEGLDSSEDDPFSEEFSSQVCHTESDSLRMLSDTLRRTVHDASLSDSFHCKLDVNNHDPHYIIMDKVIEVRFERKDYYYDLFVPFYTSYFAEGILNHNSLKSSFCSLEMVLGIMQHPDTHACVLRKTASTCRGSVFKQIQWAINKLMVPHLWEANMTELKWVYIPTGQEIIFRGLDDPEKLKSLKQPFGYYRYLWFEELTEFDGMEEVRNVMQTILRGGHKFQCFFSYNPPPSAASWVNVESNIPMVGRKVYSSTYLDVPKEWLGEEFFKIAEALKLSNERAYRHEYLGEVTGTGGQFFDNVYLEDLSGWRDRFDGLCYGVDFGKRDPNVLAVTYYDDDRRTLYILDEIYQAGISVRKFAKMIEEKKTFPEYVVCDCADTTAIDVLNEYEINAIPCMKGKGSIKRGLDWLQSLDRIVIDPNATPNAAREFTQYEYKRDRYRNWTEDGSDIGNHFIDAVRYSQESNIRGGGLGS